MPVEFRLGVDGLPCMVEFANVSVWPRRPEPRSAQGVPKTPVRSKTLPSVRTQKPLPAVPDTPTRSGSIRRVLRRFSEPARKPSTHSYSEFLSVSAAPTEATGTAKTTEAASLAMETEGSVRRRSATCTRAERDAKTRASLQALTVFSMSTETLVDPDREDGAIDHEIASTRSWLHVPHPACADCPTASVEESDDLNVRSGGLQVTFRSSHPRALPSKGEDTSTRRLRRIARAIADAFAAAGMVGPPKRAEPANLTGGGCEGKSLFRGTYGQVRAALQEAGFCVRKCDEQGFDGASRVGTLFVANHDQDDNLIFTKVVLYSS